MTTNNQSYVLQGWDDVFALLIGASEGGYSNNPADPGGETMWGITKRVALANGYTGEMKDLPLATAKGIAKAQYWDTHLCDQLPIAVAYQVFDSAFNGGHPVQWLQQAVGVTADGVMGALTVGAVRTSVPAVVVMKFCAYHAQYYASLQKQTFADGWLNRIATNLLIGAQNS